MGAARAQSVVAVDPFELADKQVTPGALVAGAYTIDGAACTLTASGAKLDISACPGLLTLSTSQAPKDVKDASGTVVARVKLRADERVNATYRKNDRLRGVVVVTPADATEVVLLAAGAPGWKKDPLTNHLLVNGDVVTAIDARSPRPLMYARTPRGISELVTFEEAPPPPVTPTNKWCAVPPELAKHTLVCLEEQRGRLSVRAAPTGHFLKPNTATLVIVRHGPEYVASVSMGGTVGISEPAVANFSSLGQQAGGVTPPPDDSPVVVSMPFAARKPGTANVLVELRRASDPNTIVASQTVELIVEQGYVGAIRLGIGLVTDNAVDRAYEAHTAPGSAQPEIARTSSSNFEPEVVLGFSAFIWDGRNGRQYVSNRSRTSYLAPTPYVGIGLVGDTPNGLGGLRSIYLGLEWEPVRSFAISLTGVGRRVTRLRDGFVVGSPVSQDTSFTEERFEIGFGVVVSLSPEFLRIAAGSAKKD